MRVLLVEDNPGDARLIREVLKADPSMELLTVASLHEATTKCADECFDAALVDLGLPDSSGLETLVHLQEAAPQLALVVVTGSDDDQLALDAAKAGAQDYLVKGRVGLDLLRRSLRYAVERKRVERALNESRQQLLQVLKLESVGRLAGGIAHDFNNLLSVIMGYSEIALIRVGEDSPARASIEGVKCAVERAAALTRQLLIFSRKQVAELRVVDLNHVIRGFQKMIVRLIGEDICVETRLPEDLWPVRVDPHQMEQVLMNLAVNARDAMPKGGALRFATFNLDATEAVREPHLLSPADHVVLKVTDTGIGMPETVRAQIFDPFFTTKSAGKGTGLGLSVVYGVIKQAGGLIRAQSVEGAGTNFWIYLPRESAFPEPAQSREVETRALRGTETVLLVDDEASICEILRMTLEEHGYQVFAASDPAHALNWLKDATRLDVLVTDIVMPEMSGLELARKVTMQRPGTRVLLMSGYAADANGASVMARANPAWGRIEKPFGPQALTAAIRSLLDGVAGACTGSGATRSRQAGRGEPA